LYLALLCHRSYCCCKALPITSKPFCFGPVGSNQHSRRAHGVGFTTSGGSVPRFKHSTNATPAVFMRSFSRHVDFSSSSSGSFRKMSSCHGSERYTSSVNRFDKHEGKTSPSGSFAWPLPPPPLPLLLLPMPLLLLAAVAMGKGKV